MRFTPKRLAGLGLAAALLSSSALSACGGEAGESVPADDSPAALQAEAGEAGEGGESGEAGAMDMETLPIEHRAAFMWGHVKAGMKLYRDGFPEMASAHLLHPVSEMYAAERAGLDALGFDPAPFEAVSNALAAGTTATEIEDQLFAADEALRELNDAAAGDPEDVIAFLLDTTLDEYKIGVTDGVVTDPGEYQDAWGFVQVASELAEQFGTDYPEAVELQNELRKLSDLWPASIDGETPPASVSEVAAQISVVRLVLSSI